MTYLYKTCLEMNKMLYMFIEGTDDEKFFKSLINSSPLDIKFIKYANERKEKIDNWIKSIDSINDYDYVFLGDADDNTIMTRKKELCDTYKRLSKEKLYIVKKEIESWYYAGINKSKCDELKLKKYEFYTNEITKEDFISKINKKSERGIILSQIIDNYDISLAITRNESLCEFYEKFLKNILLCKKI